ncbi:MAG: PAS domain-containing sensor histidine kinase [Desulfovibrionaceae bacterium CG1_02_65_16]|nr:MAG: PAS domain-containing sensor histidine kinase [Desulfovibrionaceae bacterium CG1_02_65_16]
MRNPWSIIRKSLALKLIATAGLSLVLSVAALSYFAISHQEDILMSYVLSEADRLGTTIKLGTRYAMMVNARDDLNQIITNIGSQKDIQAIRIYNKSGEVKFSNNPAEKDTVTDMSNRICHVCHQAAAPPADVPLASRTRIFVDADGVRKLGIISPINNEPGCSEGCHFHPRDKKVLGVIDVVVSLAPTDREIAAFQSRSVAFTVIVLAGMGLVIFVFMGRFVIRPIRRLITGATLIAEGGQCTRIDIDQADEMGTLVHTIERMGKSISEKQIELNRQRDEYQTLFSLVPCIITVQDRNFRLLRYNQEFRDKFQPKAGDTCFHAYKGRSSKCPNCPVVKTFETGRSFSGEESGVDATGAMRHWLVTSSPVRNAEGEVVAAMEMCLDITSRKQLEDKLEKSERKYLAIFKNIPNPVFVLDAATLNILDCNESAQPVYGFAKAELVGQSFLTLFPEEEREAFLPRLREKALFDRVINVAKDGRRLYVTVRLSPSEFSGQKVLLATTSDMTKRLETEQQLIQASKMATLGEMATGMAHELNQPLSVIKTAASFLKRKADRGEEIARDILTTLTEEIDAHVDRASRIINHLREFGRKPEMQFGPVDVGATLRRALDIFSQQLKLREIEVVIDIPADLPPVTGDAGRLEQVFINMLINARDAIEDKWSAARERGETLAGGKRITLSARREAAAVVVTIGDTGAGIPPGVRDKIFEPFFTTKPVGKGTGLGLSISYGIVKDCGGSIHAESEPGAGARFIITLPLAGGEEGA